MPVGVYVVALVAWLYFVALDMLATGLPLALAAAGAGEGWIGLLAGWMGLAAMIQRPFLAAWGDRHGHGRLLVASLAAAVAGAVLFAVRPEPGAQLLARTLQGTSLAGLVVASQALMAALAPVPRRGRALALQGLADTGGVLVGTNLGEWAWHHLGRTGLFAGAAAAAGVALGLAVAGRRAVMPSAGGGPAGTGPARAAVGPGAAAGARPAPRLRTALAAARPRARRGGEAGCRQPAARPGVLPLPSAFLLLGALIGAIFGTALNLTALHAQAAGFRAGGWLAVFALVAMAARYAAGTAIDRAGGGTAGASAPGMAGAVRPARRLLAPAFGLMAAGEALLAAASGGPAGYGVYAAAVVVAAGYGIAHTALVAAAVGGAPPGRRGAAAGWLANAIDLGVGAGLAALGWVLERWSFPVMYGALAGAAGLGAVLGLATRGDRLRPEAGARP